MNKKMMWFVVCVVFGFALGTISALSGVSMIPLILAYILGIMSQMLAQVILE